MMSVQELFYGDAEPVWVVGTAAAQVIHHHFQQKPRKYNIERSSSQYKTPLQQSNFQHTALDPDFPHPHQRNVFHDIDPRHDSPHSHRDPKQYNARHPHSYQQDDFHTAPRHVSPDSHLYGHQITSRQPKRSASRGSPEYIDQQHNHQTPQKYRFQYADDHQNHNEHNSHEQKIYEVSQQTSSEYIPDYPRTPHQYSSPRQHFHDYRRRTVYDVRMKVPICCEACEERVVGRLSTMSGVQTVKCDLSQEKVTVTGNAAPADVLKACKKLFKRSEMWEDRNR